MEKILLFTSLVLGDDYRAAVREKRFELGLSQEELANKAQVERSHMGKIELGEQLPNLVLILRLAKALSIKPGLPVDQTVEKLLQPWQAQT